MNFKSTIKVAISTLTGIIAAIFVNANVNTFDIFSANVNTAIALFVSIACGFATIKATAMMLSKKAPLKSSSIIVMLLVPIAIIFTINGDHAVLIFLAPILVILFYKGSFKNKYVFE